MFQRARFVYYGIQWFYLLVHRASNVLKTATENKIISKCYRSLRKRVQLVNFFNCSFQSVVVKVSKLNDTMLFTMYSNRCIKQIQTHGITRSFVCRNWCHVCERPKHASIVWPCYCLTIARQTISDHTSKRFNQIYG